VFEPHGLRRLNQTRLHKRFERQTLQSQRQLWHLQQYGLLVLSNERLRRQLRLMTPAMPAMKYL
jgi:hypothetical protein